MWIDRDAVTSKTRPWVKRHVTKGLRSRGRNNFPYINAKQVSDNGQFIDHTNIDSTEHILQKLGEFRRTRRTDRNNSINHHFVERCSYLQALWCDASDDLRRVTEAVELIAWISTLWRKSKKKILSNR